MKEMFNKVIQTSTAMLLFCIVVCGIVYAQLVCCSTIVDACIPTSGRLSVSYNIDNSCRISPSHNRNNQQQPTLCSKNIIADFGSGDGPNQRRRHQEYQTGDAGRARRRVDQLSGAGYAVRRSQTAQGHAQPGAVDQYRLSIADFFHAIEHADHARPV